MKWDESKYLEERGALLKLLVQYFDMNEELREKVSTQKERIRELMHTNDKLHQHLNTNELGFNND